MSLFAIFDEQFVGSLNTAALNGAWPGFLVFLAGNRLQALWYFHLCRDQIGEV
jgi:hypothetical protein